MKTHLDIKSELLSDLNLDINKVSSIDLRRQVPGLGDDGVRAVAGHAGTGFVYSADSDGHNNI